jgi:hypothetical protein
MPWFRRNTWLSTQPLSLRLSLSIPRRVVPSIPPFVLLTWTLRRQFRWQAQIPGNPKPILRHLSIRSHNTWGYSIQRSSTTRTTSQCSGIISSLIGPILCACMVHLEGRTSNAFHSRLGHMSGTQTGSRPAQVPPVYACQTATSHPSICAN